jgi:hypothetical protein
MMCGAPTSLMLRGKSVARLRGPRGASTLHDRSNAHGLKAAVGEAGG